MTNYFPTGVRPSIRRIRGMSGLGAVDWSTCASTRPDPDDPTHFVDCLNANGAVIDSKETPASAPSSSTIFGYNSTLVIGIGAGLALLLLLKRKKGGR